MGAASVIDSMCWTSGFFIVGTPTLVTTTSRNTGLKDLKYPYGCRLKHNLRHDRGTVTTWIWWDTVGVWAIETFGLPGDQYVTETLQDHMIFWFRQEADASMFMLRFGQADFISFEHHNH